MDKTNRKISYGETSGLIVGLGDIGKNLARRMLAADMKVSYCDPGVEEYLDL